MLSACRRYFNERHVINARLLSSHFCLSVSNAIEPIKQKTFCKVYPQKNPPGYDIFQRKITREWYKTESSLQRQTSTSCSKSTVHKTCNCCKARYTLATKLNSTWSTMLKVDKVDRVALAPYTLATKSTATSCRIHFVADLVPKPATKLKEYGNSRLCCRFVAGFGYSRLSTKWPCWIQLRRQCIKPGTHWQSTLLNRQ